MLFQLSRDPLSPGGQLLIQDILACQVSGHAAVGYHALPADDQRNHAVPETSGREVPPGRHQHTLHAARTGILKDLLGIGMDGMDMIHDTVVIYERIDWF